MHRILLFLFLSTLLSLAACNKPAGGGAGDTMMGGGSSDPPMEGPATETTPTEPQFKREGRLAFVSAKGDTIKKIDIEIADSETERTQGLMYRSTINEETGMLFLFEQPEIQSFWMKNTPSSLDILFLSPSGEILNIYRYTTPFSEAGLPSQGRSDKVVEVKGGFCDKYHVKEGGRISYRRS